MKKLIVAIAIAVASIAANAATVNWASGAVLDHTGASLGSSSDYEATIAFFTYDVSTGYTDVTKSFTGTLTDDTANKGSYNGAASSSSLASQDLYAKIVIQNDEWSYTSGYAKFAYDKDATAAKSVNLKTLGALASNSSGTADYGWVAAPEPTSGLLLLLGMSALALRRKQKKA